MHRYWLTDSLYIRLSVRLNGWYSLNDWLTHLGTDYSNWLTLCGSGKYLYPPPQRVTWDEYGYCGGGRAERAKFSKERGVHRELSVLERVWNATE